MSSPGFGPESATVPRLPWRHRPLGARLAVGAMAPLLLGTGAFVWMGMPGEVRGAFSGLQTLTLVLFLVVALLVLNGVFRTAVHADTAGLTVVNVYRVRRLEWAQVLRVNLRRGDAWAVLDTDDGTTVYVMAIQGSDGDRARRAARQLRQLVDQQTTTSTND
ncbi:MAG: PH domain-containing protein [Actinomycetota bacterium]|nr:PH domain-containing protein [Actinomycetota bacterium]